MCCSELLKYLINFASIIVAKFDKTKLPHTSTFMILKHHNSLYEYAISLTLTWYCTMLWKNCGNTFRSIAYRVVKLQLVKSENWMLVKALFCQIQSQLLPMCKYSNKFSLIYRLSA